jgi:hypothetical protein
MSAPSQPPAASKSPTPPAAFRSALLFPEDAKLKAFSTPDSPNENPLNQPRAESPEAARPPSAQENLARYRQQAAAPPPPPSAKAVARQAAVVAAADERAAAAAAEAATDPVPPDVDSPHPMLPDEKTYAAGYKAVAFDAGPFGLVFDAAVDSKGGKGPDIGLWTRWGSGKGAAQKRRRAAPKKSSP